jgi:hypothetical protein
MVAPAALSVSDIETPVAFWYIAHAWPPKGEREPTFPAPHHGIGGSALPCSPLISRKISTAYLSEIIPLQVGIMLNHAG